MLILFNFRNVPRRARVRLARRRNEDEDSANKLYTLVTSVRVDGFKGLKQVPLIHFNLISVLSSFLFFFFLSL